MARYIYFQRVWSNPFAVHVRHIADENDQPLCRVRYSGDNRFKIEEGESEDQVCRRCQSAINRRKKQEAA